MPHVEWEVIDGLKAENRELRELLNCVQLSIMEAVVSDARDGYSAVPRMIKWLMAAHEQINAKLRENSDDCEYR